MSSTKAVHLLILAICLSACGDPHYRLEGQIVPALGGIPSSVALLDSTASHKIASLHALYTTSSDSLARSVSDSLAAIDAELTRMDQPIKTAERRLRSARNAYAVAFKAMDTHVSFGGNRIFEKQDQNVRTETLLEEIQDRFYKGKAFSLETGSQIRRTIREKLVPAENRVDRGETALRKLQRDQKAVQGKRRALEQSVSASESDLVTRYNRRVLDRIEGGVLLEAAIDTARTYRFDKLAAGRYHLYLRTQPPRLLGVDLNGHLRIRITPDDPSPLVGVSG